MKRFYISIYFIVPLIFGLLSVFSFIISFRTIGYCLARNLPPEKFLLAWGIIIFIATGSIAYLILRFVLRPSERFVEKVRQSSVVKAETDEKAKGSRDQVEEFSRIFDQVAQTLDALDALDTTDAKTLFPEIITKSRTMRQIFAQILRVGPKNSSVLICGESGTGKELVANSIVEHSLRKDRPFIRINCAAISPNLMESELFGHEKGAFTGAVSKKKGCFEQAHTGTLFLDEIGDIPLELQVKLLRVLQEKTFFRVGGEAPLITDVRIISATNKNLETAIADKKFREDLFYRINVFPMTLPPLRRRKEDIEVLAVHFLSLTAPGKVFDPAALSALKEHDWPGNVRELENTVERAAVLADRRIGIEHLPFRFNPGENLARSFSINTNKTETSLDHTLEQIEKRLICEALGKNHGIQVRAAEELGINQRSLWNRVKKFEININEFKEKEKRSA